MKVFGILSMALFICCFIPQIIKTYKIKTVKGVSLWLWIMVVSGYLSGLIYTIYLKDGVLIATYSAGLILSSIILFGYYRYR